MFFECTYYQCHLKNFPSPRLWIRRCLFMPMWLVNLGRYFELPEQMPCNTPACHDDMSHIRIGTLSTASPLQMLLSNNKQVVPENAVQTCQGAAWGARRWEEHDARRRFFFQSVFEPGGQEGLTTSTATRLLQVASSIAYICMGNSASRLVNVVVCRPPPALPHLAPSTAPVRHAHVANTLQHARVTRSRPCCLPDRGVGGGSAFARPPGACKAGAGEAIEALIRHVESAFASPSTLRV